MANNFYDEEITKESFQELKKFLWWMNKRGTYPTIIGGWAVFAYEGGIGSRDIDAVMPDTNSIDQILEDDYFLTNQYLAVKRGFIPDHYKKIIDTKNGKVDIIFDIFNGENQREDTENLGISFHWGWTLEHQEEKQIGDLHLYVPKRELLIITKIIAAVGRTEEFRLSADARLPSKIWKDYRDIAALTIGKEIERKFFDEYVEKSNLGKLVPKFVSGYQDNRYKQVLEEQNGTFDEIKNSLLWDSLIQFSSSILCIQFLSHSILHTLL